MINKTIASYTGVCALAALSFSYMTDAEARESRTFHISGRAVTGPNDFCGEPEWVLPPPFPPDMRFTLLGSYDDTDGATDAIELSPTNCSDDLILATHTNVSLNSLSGLPDSDPRIKNIPLQNVPVKVGLDGTRMIVPAEDQVEGNPFPVTRALPNDPITFGQWRRAKGQMNVLCYRDGTAEYSARFQNLIPNGVYTIVATWALISPDAGIPTFAPLPFGGLPNEVVADARGRAKIKRYLSHCPLDITPDGSALMFVDLGYHADGTSYGAFPQTTFDLEKFVTPDGQAFESPIPPGILAMPHVGFPIRSTER